MPHIALTLPHTHAHGDTARLVAEEAGQLSWDAHLDYLRELQRVGRELLASAAAERDAARAPLPASGTIATTPRGA